ncbi:MAG: hypothetical protein AAFY08_04190 [Planctomycetota bacterium]
MELRHALLEIGGTQQDHVAFEMTEQARSVLVFGSFCSAYFNHTSDLDLLCVGPGRRYKSRRLDIVWIDEKIARNTDWLGSELACHIKHFGASLDRDATWIDAARPSVWSVERKIISLRQHTEAVLEFWQELCESFRTKRIRLIMMDLLRLRCLKARQPVPVSGALATRLDLELLGYLASLDAEAVRLKLMELINEAADQPHGQISGESPTATAMVSRVSGRPVRG